MHIPQQEQFAPADETEEEREQREQETYLPVRFHNQERHYNDSYNPNMVKTQNFVYPAAADCEVDLARPTILLNTGIDSVSPPEPPKAKPDTGQFTFDTLKKRRKKRQADKSWMKNKILTQQNHVRKLEFVEISPKNIDKILDKYKTSFEKDPKKYDKLFEYEAEQMVHAEPRISNAVRPARLPYGPLLKPPEAASPSSYSLAMDSGWLSNFV